MILIVVGVIVSLLAVVFLSSREPEYEGKRLSEWLMYIEVGRHPLRWQAKAAVHQIGTNALPYLVEWIRYETPSSWRIKTTGTVAKFLGRNLDFWGDGKKQIRMMHAMTAFRVLGPEGAAAIPDLTRLINDPTALGTAERAIQVLGYLGKPALPALQSVLTNQQTGDLRYYAAQAISEMGTNARPAVPALLKALNDRDPYARAAATNALRWIDPEALEKAVAP